MGRCQLSSGRNAANQHQGLLPENPRDEPPLVRLRERAETNRVAVAKIANDDRLRSQLEAIEHERALTFGPDGRSWTADDVVNDARTTGADVEGAVELEAVLAPREREAQARPDAYGAAAIAHEE